LGIPVAHVEAGVRSGSLAEPWPEEYLRVEIDRMATWRYAPTARAVANLLAERLGGLVTGNTVVDALRQYTDATPRPETSALVLVTLHRRELYLRPDAGDVLDALCRAATLYPGVTVAWPVHPATRKLVGKLAPPQNVRLLDPLPHAAFADMLCGARAVLTDSGGVVEEAATLGVPTAVLRNETDRPEAEAVGIAQRFPTTPEGVLHAMRVLVARVIPRQPTAVYGDGYAAERIVHHLATVLRAR